MSYKGLRGAYTGYTQKSLQLVCSVPVSDRYTLRWQNSCNFDKPPHQNKEKIIAN